MPKGIYNHKHKPWNKGKRYKLGKIKCKQGKHSSKETEFKKGFIPWNKGIKTGIKTRGTTGMKHTEEWKRKNGERMTGDKHFNWKGGISKDVHSISEPKYRKWRSDVFTRDNWTCRTCGEKGIYLEAHHIKSWSKFPELRYILDNGLTLCKECHKLTNNYKGKKYE
jgi:predicted restriction endonuclease